MLRVCLLAAIAGSGGAEHHVLSLAQGLRGVAEVTVLTPQGSWLAGAANAAEVPVATLPEPTGNLDVRYLLALRRLLRQLRPDVLHTHLGRSDWYGWLATRGLPAVTLVSTEHGISDTRPELYGSAPMRALRQLGHRRRLRDVAAVIAVSRFTADALVRRYPALRSRPPAVVYPGIDVAKFAALPRPAASADGGLRLACVSRLSAEKGVDVLLRALAELQRRGVSVTAQICGDGDERAALEALAAELGIGDGRHLPGPPRGRRPGALMGRRPCHSVPLREPPPGRAGSLGRGPARRRGRRRGPVRGRRAWSHRLARAPGRHRAVS